MNANLRWAIPVAIAALFGFAWLIRRMEDADARHSVKGSR